MSKITHPEIYQFFSGLISNTNPIPSTTNFRTRLGILWQVLTFPALQSGSVQLSDWQVWQQQEPHRDKGASETHTGSFWSSVIESILQEKLGRISKVLEGKTDRIMHLHPTKIRKAAIWLCEASSTFLFIRKHSANIKTQGPSCALQMCLSFQH